MKRTAYMIIAVALATPAIASAQHSGSMDDQLACTPDVYRLCSQFIPDEDTIVTCLQHNKPQLSAGCQAVFSKPAPTPTQPKDSDDD